ncbi:hypothetical protein NE236_41855 [Actinoallomurus purpureus]|uniref:hypothetical protein n=1 Tax=Actinoallomurus purpureus TaxID=478114 RepID=UPI0020927530|nr:hypothetical protein [Actinoallomurus purpureus]MCO6011516.1 hypothetical protein [Actinoallomurus purpureus]
MNYPEPPVAPIIKLQRTCQPCRDARHDICEQWIGELFDEPHHDCPCGCRTPGERLTQQALVEMMRTDPIRTARHVVVAEAFNRGSFDLHQRMRGRIR